MNCVVGKWPEPIVPVQVVANGGLQEIPHRYIQPPSNRPEIVGRSSEGHEAGGSTVPIVDLARSMDGDAESLENIARACTDWGFFHVVNHGVNPELVRRMRAEWDEFFSLPVEEKQAYANSPTTYEGYGSRVGIDMDSPLDWSDYFFLVYLPQRLKDPTKWPVHPSPLRGVVEEYAMELDKISRNIMKALSVSLGLGVDALSEAFGMDDRGATLRVNFYPKCPQPDLTLGLSSHSDPGGLTLLLGDDDVPGLQVRNGSKWVPITPLPDSFTVNIGDQVQVLTNGQYKSVEHRVTVNSVKERMSVSFFVNPKDDLLIKPMKELAQHDRMARFSPMTYRDYKVFIRTRGLRGKSQLDSRGSPSPVQKHDCFH